jgi:hypothetical protein
MKYSAFMTKRARGLAGRAGLASIVLAALLVLSSSALAAGDANEASCPPETEASPGFRAFLPDCRAYEMVTPPFTGGSVNAHIEAVSSDGERVIFTSLSAFASTESDPFNGSFGAVYQLARTGSGWVTSSITPPTSLSPDSQLMGVSSDGTRSLWEVLGSAKSVDSTQLDLREPNGSFVEVGQLTPPAASQGPPAGNTGGGENSDIIFAGASANLSHALFDIRGREFYWPGDTTGGDTQGVYNELSLYEYVGTGNTRPTLVGVNNEGDLISECGTEFGYNSQESYNAVSASGETVFFTPIGREAARGEPCASDGLRAPEVDELYARLDQVQTVSISEPSSGDCKRCRTGEAKEGEPATTEQPAIFQGASEDGSKAFFLTEQELLAGDTGMNLYEYDFDNPSGEKVLRVSGGAPGHESLDPEVQGVARVSEDGSHVYFVAHGVLTGANGEGNSPSAEPEADNLYVFERDGAYPGGRTAFVATLSSNDAEDWRRVDDRPVQATPDGQFLVFDSAAGLLGNSSGLSQVYEYDAQSERLVRVSVGAANYPPGAISAETYESTITPPNYDQSSAPTHATTNIAVSEDGTRIVFYGRADLAEGAEAGKRNVYEYRDAGGPGNAGVSLIAANMEGEEAGLDATGADVFFKTVNHLVPSDVDTEWNLYDAREDGGFPASVAPASCAGEGCQAAPSVSPPFGAPGSASASGGGNLTGVAPAPLKPLPEPMTVTPKPVKCRKGFTKEHGRCVKAKKKKPKAKGSSDSQGSK